MRIYRQQEDSMTPATENGMAHLSSPYSVPETLKQRHNIPDDLVKNISGIGALLQKVLE